MSDESSGIEQLITLMQQIHAAVQTLTSNQERLRQEQDNAQQALAGISALLQVHTKGLNLHQRIIEALAAESGLSFAPEDPSAPPNDPVN